jgi:hypothetical protein
MHRLRGLSPGRRLVALAVGGAIFGIATAVQADIPDGGVINSCYGKTNGGFLRVIDASRARSAPSTRARLPGTRVAARVLPGLPDRRGFPARTTC